MQKITAFFLFAVVLSACANHQPAGPVGAQQVNPDIEQRIEQRVAEGRAAKAPSIHDVPDDAPEQLKPRQTAQTRAQLEADASALKNDVEADREEVDFPTLEERAARLKAEVERDRALKRAEGSAEDLVNRGK